MAHGLNERRKIEKFKSIDCKFWRLLAHFEFYAEPFGFKSTLVFIFAWNQ